MVLCHDANCFIDYFGAAHDAGAAAAPNWHYERISDDVLPALRDAGVTQEQIDTMLVENPVRYFTGGRCGVSAPASGPPDRSGPVIRSSAASRHDRRPRGPDGIKRYGGLPRNLVHMLRASVDRPGAPPRPSSRPAPRMPGVSG